MENFICTKVKAIVLSNFWFLCLTGLAFSPLSGSLFAQSLIAAWDFQTTSNGGTAVLPAPNTPKIINSNLGTGTLFLDGTNGSSFWNSSTTSTLNQLNAFNGTALNAAPGMSTSVTSPASLALVNNSANGFTLVMRFSMTDYTDLNLSYATQRSTTGFTQQTWEYSTNGILWLPWQNIAAIPTIFGVINLNTLNSLNHVSDAYVRLTVTGATTSAGNNRLDNIQLQATYNPLPAFDPALSQLNISPGNCLDSNQTFEAVVCNQGTQPIDLTLHPVTITLTVQGPAGNSVYTHVLNSGFLSPQGFNCKNDSLTQVNLFQGGTYLMNAVVSCPLLPNGNTANDSLTQAIIINNPRPLGTDYALCPGGSIPTGQGLVVSGCSGIYEWYTNAAGGVPFYTGNVLNPVLIPGSGITNTQTAGVYTYYAACASDPDCRVPVSLIIDATLSTWPSVSSVPTCAGTNLGQVNVNVPLVLYQSSPVSAQYPIGTAVFGPSIGAQPISGQLKSYSNPDTGCVAYPAGTFAGKIALIDRGSCFFELKAYNAEQAGALAVVIVNNIPGPPITMGAANMYSVNIPIIMVSDVDGQALKNLLSLPDPVMIHTSAPFNQVLWSTSDTTLQVNNLSTGFYSVTVVDSQGCVAHGQTYVISRGAPAVSFASNAPCSGQSTGSSVATLSNFPQEITIDLGNAQGKVIPMAPALFGPRFQNMPLFGYVMYYSNPDDGCAPYPPNTFTGKIALIDRGSCTFEQKVYNAEQAGAVGVIIVNNVPDPIFTPGIANLFTLNIPSMMISQADGQQLKNWLLSFPNLLAFTPSYQFLWYDANASYPQPILSMNSILQNQPEGTYVLQVADNHLFSCTNSDTVVIPGLPLPPAPEIKPITNNAVLCSGESSIIEISNNALFCASFNGIDQWIDLGVNTTNLNDASFTLEAWIRTSGTEMGVIGSGNNDALWEPGERAFYIDVNGHPAFVGFGNNYLYSTEAVNDNSWHHIAVSWDYPNGTGRIFVDGSDRTVYGGFAANSYPNIGQFNIGRPNFGEAPNFFQGQIDEVKIWNIARSQLDIIRTMSYPMEAEPGLISYYRLDDIGGVLLADRVSGYHATPVNQPALNWSDAFNNIYNLQYDTIGSGSGIYPRWLTSNPGNYTATITTSLGCTSPPSQPFTLSVTPEIIATGPTTFCDSGASVTLQINPVTNVSRQFATRVLNYSSQYSLFGWGVMEMLDEPDVYPLYGDITTAWASALPDNAREFVELGFPYGQRINYVDVYETFNPGSVDTVYVRDSVGIWHAVYAAPATIEPPASRIHHIRFQDPGYPVFEIRLAFNSGFVPGWNEIDAVAIGYEPEVLWSNGDTTLSTTIASAGNYYAQISENATCVLTSNNITVIVEPCTSVLDLKLYLEGYYTGQGVMNSVLMNQGVSNDPMVCDTISVDLCEPNFPYSVLETSTALLYTDGTAHVLFQTQPAGNYYLQIRHRHTLPTWSAFPVQVAAVPSLYSFSQNAAQAYGNNMREVEPGVWALYAGELYPDLNIDLLDLSLLETAVENFLFGYYAEDINGDGNVDLLDIPVPEGNLNNFIFAQYP